MSRIEIWPVGETSAHIAAALVRRAYRTEARRLGLTRWDCPGYAAFEAPSGVRRRLRSGGRVLVMYESGQPVGTVSTIIRGSAAAEIARLAVVPECRGRGLGRSLMAFAERELTEAGVATAEVSIVARFDHLRRYYEDLGYSAARLERFQSLPFDVQSMEKPLAAGSVRLFSVGA
jgi:GNAT superfamily N-acetyltransferase